MKRDRLYQRHEEIKNELELMSKKCRTIKLPIGIAHIIYEHLQKHHPSQNILAEARNVAYMFSCLCTEYRLMVESYKITDEFFMDDRKWAQYLIGPKLQKNGLAILKEMSLIDCNVRVLRCKPIFRITMININLETLRSLQSSIHASRSTKWYTRWDNYKKKCEKNYVSEIDRMEWIINNFEEFRRKINSDKKMDWKKILNQK